MKKKTKYHITYNAPITLTFTLLSAFILLLDSTLLSHKLIPAIFVAPGCQGSEVAFNWHNALDYLKLFTHILGHSDWNHLLANFSFILLLGPLLEEKYGSVVLLIMILVTAFVTGVINATLIPAALMGSSGIAFMMILLASFSTMSKHEIPLSFILIFILYIGRDLFSAGKSYNIATFAHIAGGICGSMFGFLASGKNRSSSTDKINKTDKSENLGKSEKSAKMGKSPKTSKISTKDKKVSKNSQFVDDAEEFPTIAEVSNSFNNSDMSIVDELAKTIDAQSPRFKN